MILLCPLALFGQGSPDFKPIQGRLVQRSATIHEGVWQATVRTSKNDVIAFTFDSSVVIDRGRQNIQPKDLAPGEIVEVFLAEVPGSTLRQAESIHVLPVSAPPPLGADCGPEGAAPRHTIWFRHLSTSSGVAFAGVIQHCEGSRLLLHTRNGENRTIILGPNTQYFEDGISVGPERLQPNMRVFIRAEKSLLSDLEADQVIWGTILRPR